MEFTFEIVSQDKLDKIERAKRALFELRQKTGAMNLTTTFYNGQIVEKRKIALNTQLKLEDDLNVHLLAVDDILARLEVLCRKDYLELLT